MVLRTHPYNGAGKGETKNKLEKKPIRTASGGGWLFFVTVQLGTEVIRNSRCADILGCGKPPLKVCDVLSSVG